MGVTVTHICGRARYLIAISIASTGTKASQIGGMDAASYTVYWVFFPVDQPAVCTCHTLRVTIGTPLKVIILQFINFGLVQEEISSSALVFFIFIQQ
jgi:hypothetical protein